MPLALREQPVPLVQDESGVIKVRGTRITISLVLNAFLEGNTAEEIVDQYDTLALADVYSIIAFYLNNRAEVDEYLRSRREHAEQLREEIEKKFPRAGRRERLLARRIGP